MINSLEDGWREQERIKYIIKEGTLKDGWMDGVLVLWRKVFDSRVGWKKK